ncbi:MAG: methyl-accepting chemotaxis protein [Thermoplasmata archaeon]|nr:methyl-accepting chemotaxis protein [Thermoplasmata archaeon]
MKLGPKMIAAFLIVALLSGVVGAVVFVSLTDVNTEVDHMEEDIHQIDNSLGELVDIDFPATEHGNKIEGLVYAMEDAAAEYLLGDNTSKAKYLSFKQEVEHHLEELMSLTGANHSAEISNLEDVFEEFYGAAEDTEGIFNEYDIEIAAEHELNEARSSYEEEVHHVNGEIDALVADIDHIKVLAKIDMDNAVESESYATDIQLDLAYQLAAINSYLLGNSGALAEFNDMEQKYDEDMTALDALVASGTVDQEIVDSVINEHDHMATQALTLFADYDALVSEEHLMETEILHIEHNLDDLNLLVTDLNSSKFIYNMEIAALQAEVTVFEYLKGDDVATNFTVYRNIFIENATVLLAAEPNYTIEINVVINEFQHFIEIVENPITHSSPGIFALHDEMIIIEGLLNSEIIEMELNLTVLVAHMESNRTQDEIVWNETSFMVEYVLQLQVILGSELSAVDAYALGDSGSLTLFNQYEIDFASKFTQLDDLIDPGSQEQDTLDTIDLEHTMMLVEAQTVFDSYDNAQAAKAAAALALSDFHTIGEEIESEIEDLLVTLKDDMQVATEEANTASAAAIASHDEVKDSTTSAIEISIIVAIIAIILGIIIGYFFSRSITRPVTKLMDGSKSLAKGDFNAKLDVKAGNDEIGEMVTAYQGMLTNTAGPLRELNIVAQAIADGDLSMDIKVQAKGEIDEIVQAFIKMQENLRSLVSEIQATSATVASTSQEMASSAEEMNASTQQVSSAINQISKGSQEQADKVEETAGAMKQVSTSVDDVSMRAEASVESATVATSNVSEGRQAVEQTVKKMKEIQKVVASSSETIETLGDRSKEIGEIVDVITNITDQTNLLALNAAIEAARAGDQGRGFAVVADEVKALAEDSREAAERISKMIKEIQSETDKAVGSMKQGTKEVEEGMALVSQTDSSFQQIADATEKVNSEIGGISAATQQQKAGTQQVAAAVDGIASIAEESASASEESASSTEELTASMEEMTAQAQELSEMALSLQNSAARFKLGDEVTKKHKMTQKAPPKKMKKIKKNEAPVPRPKDKTPIPANMGESLLKRGIELPKEE